VKAVQGRRLLPQSGAKNVPSGPIGTPRTTLPERPRRGNSARRPLEREKMTSPERRPGGMVELMAEFNPQRATGQEPEEDHQRQVEAAEGKWLRGGGNATKMVPPLASSHTSLPSQTWPTARMTVARSGMVRAIQRWMMPAPRS